MAALESWLAPLFAKTPHLPDNIRQSLTQIAPWLALVAGILGLLGASALFSMFGFMGSMMSMQYMMMGSTFPIMLALVISLIAAILDLLAFKPLSARQKKGWNLLFYGVVLSAVSFVINLFFGYATIGSVIGVLIGLWLLFEIRGLYR